MRRSACLPAQLAAFALAGPVAVPATVWAQAPADQSQPDSQTPPAAAQSPAPTPRAAETQVYYHAGVWDAFSGRSANGGPQCGVSSTNPGDQSRFSIQFDIGGTNTVLAAEKPGWAIPDRKLINVVMQVGLNTPWTMRGNGHGHLIEWTLGRDAMQRFDQQFRSAQSMTLTFPDGNEPPWAIPLAGSTAISDTFGRCVTDLTRQVRNALPPSGGATAPGTAPAATQPFSAAPETPSPAAR